MRRVSFSVFSNLIDVVVNDVSENEYKHSDKECVYHFLNSSTIWLTIVAPKRTTTMKRTIVLTMVPKDSIILSIDPPDRRVDRDRGNAPRVFPSNRQI
jgi:hypothetical protein